ncbi:hypothetical protein Tco_1560136 [Tanacetum coccineum]
MGPPPAGPTPPAGPPPTPNNGPPSVVRPNGPAPRSMEELCQPSIDGRGGRIAPILIQATDFELRHHMIQQVQNTCQFHGLPGDDANRHIDKFLEITQHMKQNGVSLLSLIKDHTKNLATDHLSRLENPHQGDLEKNEINETFSLETLGMIYFHGDSSTLWFADIENYHAGNFVVKGMSSQQKKNSLRT